MNVHVLLTGALRENCYILISNKENAIIIDPGAQGNDILDFCNRQGAHIKMILLTHGHFDHIGAVAQIKESTGASVYIHKADMEMLNNPVLNGGNMFNDHFKVGKIDNVISLKDGEKIVLDDIKLSVMHTPGHSKGSVIYVGDGIIFTGDTLFAGSAGRTDLYGGSDSELAASIAKIKALKGDYVIFPGHEESTTLDREKKTNPYMRDGYDNIF